ncbi:DUF3288 family protein [Myxosarcina sp. GI1]|uniref:DUF3288 family protein n=1 Tax=Myxosarcina sp. GI1 TaxID=1541065 RepID=UPI00056C9E7B|nr:DUF3288 family protein [Myxosarcina sp. GI1]
MVLDQKHPQEKRDRAVVNDLLHGEPSDRNLVELGRLIIRYHNFPGARQIQQDLTTVLNNWQLNEEQLYAKTRQIHAEGNIYRRTASGEQQDWT